MNYKEIAQNSIANFLKGDINAILNVLDENIDWINPDAPEVPVAVTVKGKNNVPKFFQAITDNVDISRFVIDNYIAEGSKVVGWGSYDAKVKSTGKSFTTPLIMTWEFNPQGKCVKWQGYTNTSAQAKAFAK